MRVNYLNYMNYAKKPKEVFKKYNLNGIPGLFSVSKNIKTKIKMEIYNCAQAKIDQGTWAIKCPEHNNFYFTTSVNKAQEKCAYPDWCGQCATKLKKI